MRSFITYTITDSDDNNNDNDDDDDDDDDDGNDDDDDDDDDEDDDDTFLKDWYPQYHSIPVVLSYRLLGSLSC